MVDPLSYFSFQPVLHDWCTKGSGMSCLWDGCSSERVTRVVEVRFLCHNVNGPLPCLTPYNHKYNVLSVSLNNTFPFLSSHVLLFNCFASY